MLRFFIALYVLTSLYMSFTGKNIYPFNSYQMFSKNWENEIEIAGIEASLDEAQNRAIFEFVDIPFFQANRIFLTALYESQNPELKSILCRWLLEKTNSNRVRLFGVMKKYTIRTNGSIKASNGFYEEAVRCLRTKM